MTDDPDKPIKLRELGNYVSVCPKAPSLLSAVIVPLLLDVRRAFLSEKAGMTGGHRMPPQKQGGGPSPATKPGAG